MKLSMKILLILTAFLLGMPACQSDQKKTTSQTIEADVVIYGGTSAAVTAAVQVAKMGKKVVLVSPDKHLGGLSASGLGWTDTGDKSVIGGLARNFYHRLYQHYQKEESWQWQQRSEYGNKGQGNVAIDGNNRTMWIFEPHAAELAFDQLIEENDIPLYREEWLDRHGGVNMKGAAIKSILTLSGKEFKGRVFIDATYEGDLMATAGVSYHIGREGCDVYGERCANRRTPPWASLQEGYQPVYYSG